MSSRAAPMSYSTAPITERVRVRVGAPLSVEKVFSTLQSKFPRGVKEVKKPSQGDAAIVVEADHLVEVVKFLRDDQDHEFISLQIVSGTDYLPVEAKPAAGEKPAQEAVKGRIEIVYVLFSYSFRCQVVLKVICDRERPEVPSLCDLYRAANWYEREIYDVLGVYFKGHPNLKRILLPTDWVGHPLRKDYIFPQEYNGMKVPL